MISPTVHLISSAHCTENIMTGTLTEVKRLRQYARGTTMSHVYPQSKTNVIRVFPPDLMMK